MGAAPFKMIVLLQRGGLWGTGGLRKEGWVWLERACVFEGRSGGKERVLMGSGGGVEGRRGDMVGGV